MKTKTNLARSIASIGALILLLGSSASASATWNRDGVYVVRCDEGMTPERILERQWFARPIELQLVGTCPWFEIKRDDVTVTARDNEACPGATVDGGIDVHGAWNVELSCIAVTGDDDGVSVFGGKAILEDVHIYGSNDKGLWIHESGAVEMIGGSVTDAESAVYFWNGSGVFEGVDISNNRGTAITLESNSSLEMNDGSISNNPGDGINASRNSVIDLNGVTVADNGRNGVALFGSSHGQFNNVSIWGNVRDGIYARKLVSIDLIGGSIFNNNNGVSLNQHSFAFVARASIENNRDSGVILRHDSGALIRNGTNILGNVTDILGSEELADVVCEGDESSVQIQEFANIGSIKCNHPDF